MILTNMFPGFSTAICSNAVLVGMLTDSSDTLLFTLSGFLGHVVTASKTVSCGITNRACVLKELNYGWSSTTL